MARRRNNNGRPSNDKGNRQRGKPKGDRAFGKQSMETNPKEGDPENGGSEPPKDNVDPKGRNDPAWYAGEPQLLLDAASISSTLPLGTPIQPWTSGVKDISGAAVGTLGDTYGYSNVGINTIVTAPVYPKAETFNDPLNLAAHMLYTHVRYTNSGRKNYDQADLMMYVMAVSDLYSYSFYLKRIYNAAFMFSQRNLFYNQLLESMHVDADDIVGNLAQFRAFINWFIAKISTLVVPASIELFKRRAFMYQAVYCENSELSLRDQLYLFIPSGFFKWKLDDKNKSMVEFIPFQYTLGDTGGKLSFSALKDYANNMLADLIGDEDIGIMSGDIMRSFEGNLIGITSQEEEGILVPIYDEYVLHQIKNATLIRRLQVGQNCMRAPMVAAPTWKSSVSGEKDSYDPMYKIPLSRTSDEKQDVLYGNVYQDGMGNIQYRPATPFYWRYGSEGTVMTDNETVLNLQRDVLLSTNRSVMDPALVVEMTRLTAVAAEVLESAQSMPNYKLCILGCGSDVALWMENYVYIPYGQYLGSRIPKLASWVNSSNVLYISDNVNKPVNIGRVLPQTCSYYVPFLIAVTYGDISGTPPRKVIDEAVMLSDMRVWTKQTHEVIMNLHNVAIMSLLSVPGVSKIINS